MRRVLVLAGVLLVAPVAAQVEPCRVCVASVTPPVTARPALHSRPDAVFSTVEQNAMKTTLTLLGFAHQVAQDPATTACNVYVAFPGSNYVGAAALASWVRAGHGVVQVGDWGPGFQANDRLEVESCSPRGVIVADTTHPIVAGVPELWFSTGYWSNDGDVFEDYIGWVTDADPNLARISGHDRGLSAREEGSGRVVFAGWRVYGRAANADDLTILGNAIVWAGRCAPPAGMHSIGGR